jgi:hypothetical protein
VEADSGRRSYLATIARWGLAGQCAALAGVTLAAYVVAATIGYAHSGGSGCLAAAVAAGLTLIGAESALLATRLSSPATGYAGAKALKGMLFGMMLRLGFPLAGSLVIRLHGDELLRAGALYYLVVFYLITLATEIGFEVGGVPRQITAGRS